MSDAENPDAAPESATQAQEAPPREEETPISAADAWMRLLEAVARLPEDDVVRAISGVARASIREAKHPEVTNEMVMAFQFMQRLGDVLDGIERRKAESVAAVMDALFSGHHQPPHQPNGAFR